MSSARAWGSIAAVAVLGIFSGPLPADVLIGNMPATYMDGSGIGGGSIKAAGFTTPASDQYKLESVTVRVSGVGGGTTPVLRLHADSGGNPGALLDTFSAPTLFTDGDMQFALSTSYTLATGATYWFSLYASSGSFNWNLRDDWAAPTSSLGFTDAGYRWSDSGAPSPPTGGSSSYNAYSAEGSLVPEPATLALLALGLPALAAWRRRK